MKPGLWGVCLLALAIWPGTVLADAHPNANDPVEPVKLTYEGKDYTFQYRGYKQPWALDLGLATGKRDTPFHTLTSYYNTMKSMTDYDALMPYLRRSNGDAGEKPKDVARQMAAIKAILAGDVLIFGEILYGGYTIYIYRYTKSIKRHLGLPIRKFDDGYAVVQDLVVTDPLAARFSALRYDVERLKREYPARK
jgi:hypothetical protein